MRKEAMIRELPWGKAKDLKQKKSNVGGEGNVLIKILEPTTDFMLSTRDSVTDFFSSL